MCFHCLDPPWPFPVQYPSWIFNSDDRWLKIFWGSLISYVGIRKIHTRPCVPDCSQPWHHGRRRISRPIQGSSTSYKTTATTIPWSTRPGTIWCTFFRENHALMPSLWPTEAWRPLFDSCPIISTRSKRHVAALIPPCHHRSMKSSVSVTIELKEKASAGVYNSRFVVSSVSDDGNISIAMTTPRLIIFTAAIALFKMHNLPKR